MEKNEDVTILKTPLYVSPRTGDPHTIWQHVRIAAFAENGRVLYEEFGKWEIVGPDGVERGDFGDIDTWRRNNQLAQAGFHQAMLAWLENDSRPPGTHLERSLHEWAVVSALYQSALEHCPVELDGFDPPHDLVERYRAAQDR